MFVCKIAFALLSPFGKNIAKLLPSSLQDLTVTHQNRGEKFQVYKPAKLRKRHHNLHAVMTPTAVCQQLSHCLIQINEFMLRTKLDMQHKDV